MAFLKPSSSAAGIITGPSRLALKKVEADRIITVFLWKTQHNAELQGMSRRLTDFNGCEGRQKTGILSGSRKFVEVFCPVAIRNGG